MRLVVAGDLVAESLPSVEAAVEEAIRRLPPRHGLGRIWLDGVGYEGVSSLENLERQDVHEVEIEVLPATELARRMASSLVAYLPRVLDAIDALTKELREGNASRLANLEELYHALSFVDSAAHRIRIAHLESSDQTLENASVGLVAQLEPAVGALEVGDFVGATDVLAYQLRPELEKLLAQVKTWAAVERP